MDTYTLEASPHMERIARPASSSVLAVKARSNSHFAVSRAEDHTRIRYTFRRGHAQSGTRVGARRKSVYNHTTSARANLIGERMRYEPARHPGGPAADCPERRGNPLSHRRTRLCGDDHCPAGVADGR